MSEDDHERDRRRKVWSGVCEGNYRPIFSYSRRLAGDGDAALELLSDTVLKLFDLLPDPDRVSNKLSYVLGSVHNAWVDRLAEKSKTESLETVRLDDLEDEEVRGLKARTRDPAIEEENERYRHTLRCELKRMNEREGRILRLHLEGYICQEIADSMEEDVRIIRHDLNVIRNRVRQRLKKRLQRAGTAPPSLKGSRVHTSLTKGEAND